MKSHVQYLGMHRTLQQGHIFPYNGVVAADASLGLALQKALINKMVATFTSNTNGHRRFACGLSRVGPIQCLRDAPDSNAILGKRGKNKSPRKKQYENRPSCQIKSVKV
jgi:hypothetical protein